MATEMILRSFLQDRYINMLEEQIQARTRRIKS